MESTFSSGWGCGHQKGWLVAKWYVRHWLQYHTARHQYLEFIIILFDSLGICQPRSTNTIHHLQHLQYLLPKHVNGQVVSNMFSKGLASRKNPCSLLNWTLTIICKGDFWAVSSTHSLQKVAKHISPWNIFLLILFIPRSFLMQQIIVVIMNHGEGLNGWVAVVNQKGM